MELSRSIIERHLEERRLSDTRIESVCFHDSLVSALTLDIYVERVSARLKLTLPWLARDRAADGAGSFPMVTWESRR